MTNSFAPSSPRYTLDSIFTRHVSSEHSDTKVALFRHANQEKININGHLNGLIIETMNYKLKLTSNKYHVTRNVPAFINSHDTFRRGGGMEVP